MTAHYDNMKFVLASRAESVELDVPPQKVQTWNASASTQSQIWTWTPLVTLPRGRSKQKSIFPRNQYTKSKGWTNYLLPLSANVFVSV